MYITPKESQFDWVNNLRVIATISVIFLHVAGPILIKFGTVPNTVWQIGNFYDSSVRFCVPIFVMISGALILPKEYELFEFLRKRLSRIVLPFIFWSLIYILYNLRLEILYVNEMSPLEVAKWVFQQLQRGSSYHLWYIYMIIGVYLFIPIIGKWVRNCREREILFFISIWIYTLFYNLPIISRFQTNIDLHYFAGYMGYLILGYYLSIKSFKNKRILYLFSIVLLLSGIAITILGTSFLTYRKGEFSGILYDFLTPNVLATSTGVFLFFRSFAPNVKKVNIVRDFISKYSYGIFLVHVIVLFHLDNIGINWIFIHPILGTPVTTVICLLISSGVIYLIHQLPFGKYIAG